LRGETGARPSWRQPLVKSHKGKRHRASESAGWKQAHTLQWWGNERRYQDCGQGHGNKPVIEHEASTAGHSAQITPGPPKHKKGSLEACHLMPHFSEIQDWLAMPGFQ